MASPQKIYNGKFNQDKFNALVTAVNAATVRPGINYKVRQSAGGTILDISPRGGSSAGTFPFKVTIRAKSGSPGEFEGSVEGESSLMKSLRPDDRQTISGLDTWFDVIGTDAIWLGIIFDDDGEITSCSIDSWGQGDDFDVTAEAWSDSNSYCEDNGDDDNPKHQASRFLVAFTIPDDDGKPVLSQCLSSHLLLRDMAIDGRAARYPLLYSAPYVSP